MKRWLCVVLTVSTLLTMCAFPSLAAEDSIYLPSDLTVIDERAFEGNAAVASIVIPKSVKSIGSRAFADCTGLTDVYIGNNPAMQIASDAFAGCGSVLFHVYPDSSAELFALSHGFRRETLEAGSPAWERTMSMVGQAGFTTSYFNSPQWTTKRLIVRRSVDYLPDISAYKPIDIVEKGYYNIFVIQFETEELTEACHSALLSDGNTIYAEEDLWHEVDVVTGAGVVDSSVWDTDDPMGFDTYAPFVKRNGSGLVKIAIVDSGVNQLSHYGAMLVDGINMLEDIDGQNWYNDTVNHGSVIASIIKDCVDDNSVRIIPVRVQGSANQLDDELLANGIDYAVAKGASIINLSMNFPQSSVVRDAINHAVSSGVSVIVAAGNDARNVSGVFPANMGNVVTVSGISPGYSLSTWSNFGSIDYCAPDNFINTTAYSTSLKRYTSFAAPMIASAYALIELDKYHSLSDMNASCILTEDPGSFGKGLPQLQRLAQVNATGIRLDTVLPDKMKIGDTVDLEWTVLPENSTSQAVSAVSGNPSVLGVVAKDNGGVSLRAVGRGAASVTLTVNGTAISVTTKNIAVEQPVTGITITGAPTRLSVGKTARLSAMVSPGDATTKSYTWRSANSCARVDQNGTVTGVSEGTAVIYATANDGYGVTSNRLSFPVVSQSDAESVDIFLNGVSVKGGVINVTVGQVRTLTYKVSPDDAEQDVIFESLNTGVASVTANGVITALRPGSASILVTASTGRNIKTDVIVNVLVVPSGVTVSASGSTTLNIGDTLQLTATLSPSDVSKDFQTITWQSANTAVATVDSNGKVTAKASGTAQITATTFNNRQHAITVTVRDPYTLAFNANGGVCATASKTVYSGQAIGDLPTPTRSGCQFLGWYSAANGGTQVTSKTTYESSGTVTIYAHWQSGWVTQSNVPAGAKVIQTSWSYREGTESATSPMNGWTANGYRWNQTDTKTVEYASFPSGEYDTGNKYYKAMNVSAYTASETETAKREVNNPSTPTGYIYWHWAYNARYYESANRIIAYKKGVYGADGFAYTYFYAIKSTQVMPVSPSSYNTVGQYPANGRTTYNCKTLINDSSIVPVADKNTGNSGLCTWRFYRIPYYTSTYTDYQKIYKFYRNVSYAANDPGTGSNITNKVKYVKWSNNQ